MNRTKPSMASERFPSMAWTPARRAAQAALMASLNANPEFAARRDAATAANSARMVGRHKNPKFAAAHSERSRARMAAMNSNPEFVAASTQRLRRLQADPIFEARRIAKRRGLDIEIPQWVPRDLWTEFLDVAAGFGEEYAAFHVRRIKREAGSFPGNVPEGRPSNESSASFSNPARPSSSASELRCGERESRCAWV
jgi:hypothetical protein